MITIITMITMFWLDFDGYYDDYHYYVWLMGCWNR